MIRTATKYDKAEIIETMKLFRKESNIKQYQDLDNEPYWNRLLDHILAGAGVVFIFPSYMMHRVTKVTKGTRRSFVLWVGGDHYR